MWVKFLFSIGSYALSLSLSLSPFHSELSRPIAVNMTVQTVHNSCVRLPFFVFRNEKKVDSRYVASINIVL
jgi:hypothetical protein